MLDSLSQYDSNLSLLGKSSIPKTKLSEKVDRYAPSEKTRRDKSQSNLHGYFGWVVWETRKGNRCDDADPAAKFQQGNTRKM